MAESRKFSLRHGDLKDEFLDSPPGPIELDVGW